MADTKIIAPFDFPIFKSSQQLSEEQEESIQAMPIPYQLSDDALFEAFSSLDEVWELNYSHRVQICYSGLFGAELRREPAKS